MKKNFILFILIPNFVFSQMSGIKFEQGADLHQIFERAKAEDRYIFIDCYATWCGPCKQMDNIVYSDSTIGDFMNANFVSVKIQLDTTKSDDLETRNLYASAHQLMRSYSVDKFPFFLFFSKDGKIVHKAFGLKSTDDFLSLAEDAMDSSKQYYTRKDKYYRGEMNFELMPALANECRELGDIKDAHLIAEDYIQLYLLKFKKEDLFAKSSLQFIASFTWSISDKGFRLFCENAELIDHVMGYQFARNTVDYVITKEYVDPDLIKADLNGEKPDWNKISTKIMSRFNRNCAQRIVINAKIRWYAYKKDWESVIEFCDTKLKFVGLDTAVIEKNRINDLVWQTFLNNNDKSVLLKSLQLEKDLLATKSDFVFEYTDTYANLLYKLGRKQEAIEFERKAMQLAEESPIGKSYGDGRFIKTLHYMQEKMPTWSTK